MAITSISKIVFDRLKSAPSLLEYLASKEVAWFTDDSEMLLGSISESRLGRDWSFVVLERDDDGVFHLRAKTVGVQSRDDARTQLLRTMDGLNQSRRTNSIWDPLSQSSTAVVYR